MTEGALEEEKDRKTFSQIVLDYERASRHDDGDRFGLMIRAVNELREHCKHHGLLSSGNSLASVEHWYTRLAATINTWVLHPDEVLNRDKLEILTRLKNEFVYIFAASGFRNMRHLISQLNKSPDSGKITIDTKKIVVLLALLGLDDLSDELIQLALGTEPQIRLHLVLGWLNQRAVITQRGEQNREILLRAGRQLEDSRINDPDIALVVNAYMYVSYANWDKKHDIKESFNHLLIKRMKEVGISTAPPPVRDTNRPRVLLPLERFRHQHAMFRALGPDLRAMRDRFELLALVEDDFIDEKAEKLFERVYKLERTSKKSITTLTKLIESIAPDIIFYPSLGMSHWTVMLSNLRLANIQIIAQGHPATSRSNYVDYVLVPKMWGDPSALYSEKILMGERPVVFDAHSDFTANDADRIEPSDREVRVAVNSKVMKLSPRMLDVCVDLAKRASIPVRFKFFPGELGWYSDGISAMIKQRLETAEVYPYQDYQEFLTHLSQCDLALAAFPFGNTNSTVDTCLLGIPTVAHFGPESPSQTDRLVMEAAGYPDWLVCDTDEKYFSTALELIEDAGKRKAIADSIDLKAVKSRLTVPNEDTGQREISDLIYFAYKNHEALQTSSERIFTWSQAAGE